MKTYISKISLALLVTLLLIGGASLTYADINLNQPIDSVIAYVRWLIFTDNWLPDWDTKAILSADPARDISLEVNGDTYIENQLLVGDYCNNAYADNMSFRVCVAWGIKIGELILSGANIENGGDLNFKVWNSLSFKSDLWAPLVVVDKSNKSVVVDPSGLTIMSNGLYVAWPAYINGSTTIWCSASTIWVIKKVGTYWQVCEPARDKDGSPTGGYSFKTISRWDGSWLPTTVPASAPSPTLTPAPTPGDTITPLPTDPGWWGGSATSPSLPWGWWGSLIPLPIDPTPTTDPVIFY